MINEVNGIEIEGAFFLFILLEAKNNERLNAVLVTKLMERYVTKKIFTRFFLNKKT